MVDKKIQDLMDNGYEVTYVRINNEGEFEPIMDVISASNKGFFPKGTKLKFTADGGSSYDRMYAMSIGINESIELEVESCRIGSWISYYRFKGYEGRHNTVMFERI